MKIRQLLFNTKYWRYIKFLWIGLFAMLLLFAGFIYLIATGKFGSLPPLEELENPKTYLASDIYADDGSILGKYYFQNRSNANYEDLSRHLIDALIATEDIRFYNHSGIDNKRLFTIVFYNLILGKRQGASTITQQLAKNLFPRKRFKSLPDKIITKMQEWITAILIEQRYTKDEIITMYLNTVEFGGNSFGIKAASKTFFGKTPKELNPPEAALLVGMLKGITKFNPVKNPENALARRNTVLNQMYKNNFITKEEFLKFKAEPIQLNYQEEDHNEGLATYLRETMRMELLKWCEENGYNLYKDGLKIYTTINPVMQKIAEEAVYENCRQLQEKFYNHWKGREPWGKFTELITYSMRRSDRYRILKSQGKTEQEILKIFNIPVKMKVFSYRGEIDTVMTPLDSIKYYKYFLQSGFMSMDPRNGKIKAWVGGHNYKYFKYDHVQVTAKRQVGSTFKPFVYTLAVDNGWSPCTIIPNTPVVFEGYPDYNPGNADDEFSSPEMTMYRGLQFSFNLVCLNLLKMLGNDAINDVIAIAQKMGISSKIEPYPSSALGTADISVFEMVGAYSTYANKGVWIKPYYIEKITDKNGNVIYENKIETNEALSEQTAYVMCKMLERVTTHGTAAKVKYFYQIPGAVGGKTGTTQNYSDGWFIGITPTLVSGVWVGCEDRAVHFRTLNLGSGSAMAMPMWANFMKKVTAIPGLVEVVNEWQPPSTPLTIELDCEKFVQPNKPLIDFMED